MSAVLTNAEIAQWRRHCLAGVGGFELTMSLPKLAFEVWVEFPFIWERLAIRDFSRLSRQRVTCTPVHFAMNMARRPPFRCGQAMLQRRLPRIREFEFLPHQPSLSEHTSRSGASEGGSANTDPSTMGSVAAVPKGRIELTLERSATTFVFLAGARTVASTVGTLARWSAPAK